MCNGWASLVQCELASGQKYFLTGLFKSSSHYSKSVNKCFVLVQHNQILTADHVSKTVTVHEVYENIDRASVRLTRQRSENDQKAAATCTIDGDKKDTISFQALSYDPTLLFERSCSAIGGL
jgi:hypothetical protein